jgi:hypothetical protein
MIWTVEKLKNLGYNVKVEHHRRCVSLNTKYPFKPKIYESNSKSSEHFLLPTGGTTVVFITTPSGESRTGVSKCHEDDRYVKKEGIKLAISRAMDQYK